jgi:hypothetical protein
MRRLLAIAMVGLCISRLFAQASGTKYTPPTAPPPPDLQGVLLRLVGLTSVTILLCGGLLWWARRASGLRLSKSDGDGRMKQEGQLLLDRNCKVTLIRVDGQPVVVTSDATGLRSLVLLEPKFETTLSEEVNGLR